MGREGGEEEEDVMRICNEGVGGASGQHALDRSKVRILLCDNDPKSSQDVLQLLCKCSYQVTYVKSARRVIDVLNAQGSEIDIILAEVELPMTKGLKMMKYIARNKELRHIPLIMMSAHDEVSLVVKCLRLGAADYLVKPLRMNELLNLWTHMWRRRRMLGMREKDVFIHDFEVPLSDPSDANTNSTILISDDTDEQLNMVADPELNISNHPECESNLSPVGPVCNSYLDDVQNVPRDGDHAVFAGAIFSLPKKTKLKVGESSAFLTYVKSSAPSKIPHLGVDMNSAPLQPAISVDNSLGQEIHAVNDRLAQESHTGEKICNMSDFQTSTEYPLVYLPSSTEQPQSRTEGTDVSGIPPMFSFPFYYPGVMNRNIISSPGQMFPGSLNNVQAHAAPPLLPQYGVVPYMPMMPSFPCQQPGTNSQSSHVAAPSMWASSMSTSSAPEVKSGKTERRAAALVKYRQKRKDRCFEKKIRYVKRKCLAESRPRVRGQFVKQVDNIDLNHNIFSGDGDSDDDEDDEPTSREVELISSPEQNASDC
ncbi:two-component response regulator-like PRR1 isoform X1 [Canna indica]|uniref:Two-component response regulator-like PRR1 isoform X1 n=1 Tax=Canna indica TaxID=4628 RepID=A0AAQ3KBT4_9LILI|nr:two-component response regulator-like PRR1 isoform X1 [Canna indica]